MRWLRPRETDHTRSFSGPQDDKKIIHDDKEEAAIIIRNGLWVVGG
jgi:hypothetical protein